MRIIVVYFFTQKEQKFSVDWLSSSHSNISIQTASSIESYCIVKDYYNYFYLK